MLLFVLICRINKMLDAVHDPIADRNARNPVVVREGGVATNHQYNTVCLLKWCVPAGKTLHKTYVVGFGLFNVQRPRSKVRN